MAYKLSYFNFRGKGEIIRLLFAQAGVSYEDVRINYGSNDWFSIKPDMPFQLIPVLEVDGSTRLCGHVNIARYIAEKYNLAGNNELENAQLGGYADYITELNVKIVQVFFYEPDQAKKVETLATLKNETVPGVFQILEKHIQANNSPKGYIFGSKLTWIDILVYLLVEDMETYFKLTVDSYPGLKKLHEEVAALPNIKKWVEERPKSDY